MAQLKAQHDASQRTVALLTSERDALSARLAALQAELKDTATHHALPVELLPFARRVLELSSHAGTLPPAELQSSLMRLAIDAITQAEGAAPAPVAPPPAPAPARSQKPAPTPTAPVTATVIPATQPQQAPPTQTQPPQPAQPAQQPQTVTAPAPENVTSVVDQTPDGQDVNTSAPPAEKNRNTAKAEAKLERALEYLATLNTTATAKPDKWVVNASILASLTGCYRPAINTFIEAGKQQIDQLNATHGLGPGHNRTKAKAHPNAIPELVKRFKEEEATNSPGPNSLRPIIPGRAPSSIFRSQPKAGISCWMSTVRRPETNAMFLAVNENQP